ncbi:DUF6417 family protein [Streptomyces sp. NBC_00996]|uniref:DUF6417 family protein n=1 Tax=Streptomyces sp. NBC_00996 TaxID=2903710 RepID=UPI00386F6D6B
MDDYEHIDLDAVDFAPVEYTTERLALLTLEEAHDALRLLLTAAQETEGPVSAKAGPRPAREIAAGIPHRADASRYRDGSGPRRLRESTPIHRGCAERREAKGHCAASERREAEAALAAAEFRVTLPPLNSAPRKVSVPLLNSTPSKPPLVPARAGCVPTAQSRRRGREVRPPLSRRGREGRVAGAGVALRGKTDLRQEVFVGLHNESLSFGSSLGPRRLAPNLVALSSVADAPCRLPSRASPSCWEAVLSAAPGMIACCTFQLCPPFAGAHAFGPARHDAARFPV